MSVNEPSQPVVVTFREVEKVLSGHEAVEAVNRVAQADTEVSDVQRGASAAAMLEPMLT